jgi:hypothetical protein
MLALHVQVTGRKEFGVLDRQILEFRDRDQLVAAQIAYFIFDILNEYSFKMSYTHTFLSAHFDEKAYLSTCLTERFG